MFDRIAADSGYILGKIKDKASAWYSFLKPGKKSGWISVLIPENCKVPIRDFAYGCDDIYMTGNIYGLSEDNKAYFSDVWSFANGWTWKEIDKALPADAIVPESRINATKSMPFIASPDHFYGIWYDVAFSNYCIFWRHVSWKDENRWCVGNYPANNPDIVIRKETVRAKRRFESRSIDEDNAIVEKLFGKRTISLPPFLNFPPTVDAASQFLSDDGQSPVDVLFEGTYKGAEGYYYGKLTWNIKNGSFTTEWYFKPGTDYPLSFTDDVLNKPGTVKLP